VLVPVSALRVWPNDSIVYAYQPYRGSGARIVSVPFPSIEGYHDYHRTLQANVLGPLYLTTSLLHHNLLKPTSVNSQPPSIVHVASAQQSLAYATEGWSGGGFRDDMFIHPIYAAGKVALSGLTAHLARELKVSCDPLCKRCEILYESFRAELSLGQSNSQFSSPVCPL
jgi:NAD(P)-dependent dehydrogenase (short-subunit alcohol dehydrogenase family)